MILKTLRLLYKYAFFGKAFPILWIAYNSKNKVRHLIKRSKKKKNEFTLLFFHFLDNKIFELITFEIWKSINDLDDSECVFWLPRATIWVTPLFLLLCNFMLLVVLLTGSWLLHENTTYGEPLFKMLTINN